MPYPLEIQKFLRKGQNLTDLQEPPYSLGIKRHPKYINLVQFAYDQLESPKGDPIVRECRGLILDEDNDWNVVAYPFNRFFNQGESFADTIDWNTARVQEKVDGTLLIMYYYDNKWQIATRGSPDASGPVGDFPWIERGVTVPLTFERLFWYSCEYWLKGLSKDGIFVPQCAYMWELTSPYNRVVCSYSHESGYADDGSRITLIGCRDNMTGKEYKSSEACYTAHYIVKEFPLTNLEEVIKAAAKLNPLRQEGFVVVDGEFHRIKIKSPAYLIIHRFRNNGSPKHNLIELIKSGEESEILVYKILDEFPKDKILYLEIKEKIENLILETTRFYESIKYIPDQKTFALKCIESKISGILFGFRKGKIKSIKSGILELPIKKLCELINI